MKAVAQQLLGHARMVVVRACALCLLMPCACVLPLQFEEEHDAGLDDNNAPGILLGTADPSMLQVATIETVAPPTFKLQVEDKDVDDTLYLRVFRDYHKLPVSPAVTDRSLSTPDANSRTVRTFMIERVSPVSQEDEDYLVEAIFQNTWGARLQPYLLKGDYEQLTRLCDPTHPDFALRRPDFHFLQSFTLAAGVVGQPE